MNVHACRRGARGALSRSLAASDRRPPSNPCSLGRQAGAQERADDRARGQADDEHAVTVIEERPVDCEESPRGRQCRCNRCNRWKSLLATDGVVSGLPSCHRPMADGLHFRGIRP
eukprot:6736919-Alexandrium_andersonii.AAC.1